MKSTIEKSNHADNITVSQELCNITTVDDFLKKCGPLNNNRPQNGFCRIFDVVFSLAVLVLLSPVFLVIGLLIKLNSPDGPVFFAHRRIGLNGEEFDCYKFRTMVPDADKKLRKLLDSNPEAKAEYERDFKLKDDPRIVPRIGDILRKTSLDELPQFYNVLIGDMSVVGPRPIVEAEKEKYGNFMNTLVSVKPGITGLWQVSGRNDTSYDTRVMLDVNYIYNKNILLDMKLIFKTVMVMLTKQGAY